MNQISQSFRHCLPASINAALLAFTSRQSKPSGTKASSWNKSLSMAILLVSSLAVADDPGTFDQPLPNGNFSAGLAQWTVEIPGGVIAPLPEVSVIAGAARIMRGSAYVAGLSQAFIAPEGLVAIRFRLTQMPTLSADGSFIPDAFDVHVSDASGLSSTSTIRPGASAAANQAAVPDGFNLSEGATLIGDTLRIPLSGASAGELLTFSVALVGAERDNSSVVAIDDVVMEIERKRPPPNPNRLNACGFFRDRYQSAARAPEIPTCWVRQIVDTGQQACLGGNAGECPAPGQSGQDAEFGRDALAANGQLLKLGAGPAGFDYNKLDASGEVLSDDADQWSCVVDNVTGLIWEVKVDDLTSPRHHENTYSWYQPDSANNGGLAGEQDGGQCEGSVCDTSALLDVVNLGGLCGASDWRMPSREELATIIHSGLTAPSMATDYFPLAGGNTWTRTPSASSAGLAWRVDMETGGIDLEDKTGALRVRLVREIR